MRIQKAKPLPTSSESIEQRQQFNEVLTTRAANSTPSLTFNKGTCVEEVRATLNARQRSPRKDPQR